MIKKKVKQPVTKGVVKVPVIMQLEMMECGAASLAMIMGYYEKWITLEQARVDCGVSRDGSSAKNILVAARSYGMETHAYRLEPEALMEEGPFPCIIHWGFNHFVVLDGFKGKKAVLNDPARGRVEVSLEEFDKEFTGICLTIEPGEGFEPEGKRRSVWDFTKERLKGTGVAVAFVVITSLISALIGLIMPVFNRIFMDRLLTGLNADWFGPFMLALIAITLVNIVMAWVTAIYSLKIQGKMAAVGNASYLWKILRLPMQFFGQRLAGDLADRQGTNASIAGTLINTFAPLALNTVMMFFYLILMLRYSVILTMIGISSIFLNMYMSWLISQKRVNITRVQMRDQAKLSSTTMSGIGMIETIKASGAEKGFFARWAGFQANVNAQNIQYARLNQWLGMIPSLFTSLANLAVLGTGVWLMMKGQFTYGKLMAFQGFLGSFSAPVSSLISAGQSMQEMITQVERVDDVMSYPEDPWFAEKKTDRKKQAESASSESVSPESASQGLASPGLETEGRGSQASVSTGQSSKQNGMDTAGFSNGNPSDIEAEHEEYEKLQGHIRMDNITFGYSRLGKPLIENFSMEVKPGQKIAFVGRSGCGKSTLAKLLVGMYQPWSGSITYDGKEISEIDRDVFTGSVSVIDQEIILFDDTIMENIRMWDPAIEDFEVIMAARDAGIHDDIIMRDGGYQHKLLEGGRDMSGGQRQRLEIARALAQDPTVCILDEATSALDAKTEHDVVQAITDRGITCIVIAHRLSTIRDCDEIVVLDQGKVVERGTHEELLAKNGMYTRLVTSE